MNHSRRLMAVVILALSVSAWGRTTQPLQGVRYEQIYGTPVDVSLEDLTHTPEAYDQRAVRTHGRLDLEAQTGVGVRAYRLRDSFANDVRIVPVAEASANFESEGIRFLGQELEVVGVFLAAGASQVAVGRITGTIQFWEYLGPPEKTKGPIKAAGATLEALVRSPGKRDGQTVRVVGKFRGRNLYGDLPAKSQRSSSDWVIKDDVYAVWITGKKPKGSGWALDAGLRRDTGKWVEVVGSVGTRAGITYIRALEVTLTSPPTPTADAQAPPSLPERPKVPPVVIFSLPLDGENGVPANSRFVVQFSKDMDESSFKGHVLLRYLGPVRPGDRLFDGMRLLYDGGRRALTVEPGDLLRSGRVIELILLPGIADMDGLSLTPRPGKSFAEAVDVLRYRVGI